MRVVPAGKMHRLCSLEFATELALAISDTSLVLFTDLYSAAPPFEVIRSIHFEKPIFQLVPALETRKLSSKL